MKRTASDRISFVGDMSAQLQDIMHRKSETAEWRNLKIREYSEEAQKALYTDLMAIVDEVVDEAGEKELWTLEENADQFRTKLKEYFGQKESSTAQSLNPPHYDPIADINKQKQDV